MRILIVDDVQYCLTTLEKILSSLGYNTIKSLNVKDALKKLDTYDDIELVITDYSMPEYDGSALRKACLTRFRDKLNGREPLFLMLTSYYSKNLREAAIYDGFKDVLVKPCKRSELKTSLENIFQS